MVTFMLALYIVLFVHFSFGKIHKGRKIGVFALYKTTCNLCLVLNECYLAIKCLHLSILALSFLNMQLELLLLFFLTLVHYNSVDLFCY